MTEKTDFYPTGLSQVPLFTTLNKSRKILRLFLFLSALIFFASLIFVVTV